MNKQSLASFNKISIEMDRLSYLINKEQIFRQQLQSALQQQELDSDSSSSVIENIDLYLKEYDNPTTKSLPFEGEAEPQSRTLQDDSETINTIFRNRGTEQDEEGDRVDLHDDKSTVILAALKSGGKKQKEEEFSSLAAKTSVANYSSLNNESLSIKNDNAHSKSKKAVTKNATSSMPSEVHTVYQSVKHSNNYAKNCSISKPQVKIESPLMSQSKIRKNINELQNQKIASTKQPRGKLSKVSKIDREQLNRLQQKKMFKKTQLSSNRRKTKRDLGKAKSTTNMNHHPKPSSNNINLITNKSAYGNISCKTLEGKKKEGLTRKNDDKPSVNHHEWQRTIDKANKKLNRINICKLQENIKKNQEKKPVFKEISSKKYDRKERKVQKKEEGHHKGQELKLHFTEQDEGTMKKLINQKQLSKEYERQTDKYKQITKKMSKSYFQILIKECRETSEQAIFKIKLVTLLLYFFDQFATSPLISNNKPIDNQSDQFFTRVAQQQIIQVLLRPKKIMNLMTQLSNILMNDNMIAAERRQIFDKKFTQINDQLDQQLQFFLIKKSMLFMYVHSLSEYINFLLQKQLIEQTKRTKLVAVQPQQKMHGFYSSRSKRDQIIKKYIKKNEGPYKFGFRCDSDRKITIQDDDICYKSQKGNIRPQSAIKHNHLTKLFK